MSLNQRIIFSATLVLIIFITLTAAALDRAFVDSTESSLRDKLTSQIYALVSAAEVSDDVLMMPSVELDALLGLPSSGVYAFITNSAGKVLWQSSSSLGATPPTPLFIAAGEKKFLKVNVGKKTYYQLALGVNWATEKNTLPLTFNIASDLDSFDRQIDHYRTTLWIWLVAMAMLLLISQAIILRWGLSPLRKVGVELNLIESGEQESIEHHYPVEIEQLTKNINQLLAQERNQKTRYRNALGDLAHSLKTPLAVLQSGINTSNNIDDNLQEQITRMNGIVEYQLQRAATAGSFGIGKSINCKSVVHRIIDSLKKVYRDKPVEIKIDIDDTLAFKGDEGDLMELLGNLLDNAFKWTTHKIEIIAAEHDKKLTIRIIDDGPGIKPEQVSDLLQRGARADQAIPGHGIGLSIVRNILDAYQGILLIDKSTSGGAEIIVTL